MKMFTKILSPTDFSRESYEGVRMAADLAEHFAAQLILVHVVQAVPTLPDPDATGLFDVPLYQEELCKAMKKKLGDVAGDLVRKSVQVQTRVMCYGDPARMICDLAGEEKCDLIVIATHGMTGWRNYVHGSVAQRVVQHTTHPVLLVRCHSAGA